MSHQPDTRFRRLREKGSKDFALACEIIDAAKICHVGITVDGQPYVVPMAMARDGEHLLLHGSIASRLMKSLDSGINCCVTVTHLDGLVLARSAFNSSMHYRSVMIFGVATAVTEYADKEHGLNLLTEHLLPGRMADIRPSTRKEINATMFLKLPLTTFTVKVSEAPPDDPQKDLESNAWAGVVPLQLKAGKPVDAPDLAAGITVPANVRRLR
jgi:nitroimidazol reductase NimA-like FMN-containing flavoprotein (pyridoxamine 5'-phosphate oxidase superfamily)